MHQLVDICPLVLEGLAFKARQPRSLENGLIHSVLPGSMHVSLGRAQAQELHGFFARKWVESIHGEKAASIETAYYYYSLRP